MAREMKNSGIEWIGAIPNEWDDIRFKYLHRGLNTGEAIDKDFWSNEKNNTVFYTAGLLPINTTYQDFPEWKFTTNNDLLLARNGTPYVYFPVANACYTDHIIRAKIKNNVCRKFVQYALQQSISAVVVNQVSIATWSASLWNEQTIPWPSVEEQEKIALFLDLKCFEIDAVIEKTKATIEEYKKLKQSVITEAVTKGICGNRTMKDSGIEWLEQIPAEWEIYRFKKLFSFGKGLPITKENLIDTGLSVISYGQIHSKTNTGVSVGQDLIRFVSEDYLQSNSSSLVNKGDFIFADTSEDLDGCGNCVYVDKEMTLFAGYHTIIAFSKSTNNRYLAYLFKTNGWRSQIRSRVSGVKLFSISKKILANTTLIMPPDEEQLKITDYLDKKCAEIDTLIAKKTNLLTELETYKKSLIYEYVTGKKEVGEVSDNTTVAMVYPYYPITLNVRSPRFAQAVLMSRILDKCKKGRGRVKLEKMLYTTEYFLGFNFDTEYVRKSAGPLDSSLYDCETIISKRNKWYNISTSKYGVSYTDAKDKEKYKTYYEKYFSEYDAEIDRIINIFIDYSTDQAEIIATLFAAWNDAIIDNKPFTDEDVVNDVLNNWHESKRRFPTDMWLRAMDEMRKNNLVPKGYGKRTILRIS